MAAAQINRAIALATWAAWVPTENRELTSFKWQEHEGVPDGKITLDLQDPNRAPELDFFQSLDLSTHCNDAYLAYQQLPYILRSHSSAAIRTLTNNLETTLPDATPFKTLLLRGLITPARLRVNGTPYCIYDHILARVHHLPLRRFWQSVADMINTTGAHNIADNVAVNAAVTAVGHAQLPNAYVHPFTPNQILMLQARINRSVEFIDNKVESIRASIRATYGDNMTLDRFQEPFLKMLVANDSKMVSLHHTQSIINSLATIGEKRNFLSRAAFDLTDDTNTNVKKMKLPPVWDEYIPDKYQVEKDANSFTSEVCKNIKDKAALTVGEEGFMKTAVNQMEAEIAEAKATTRSVTAAGGESKNDFHNLVADLDLKLRF